MAISRSSWEHLVRFVSGVEASLARDLQGKHGIGLNEYRALEYLSEAHNSELRMQDLASRLGLKQSSVSRLIDKLEQLGLAVRDVCPNDKRGIYTVLTDAGRMKLRYAAPDYERQLARELHGRSVEDILTLSAE